ncbi:MAG: DNA alkylation repair protein [Gemmataceae bacterium]|nr:DNA alkylation repair protein [Gemmataceae bacterium]MCI0739399.1 DNA alkylation repair protein [Gemmataceae bacterium]
MHADAVNLSTLRERMRRLGNPEAARAALRFFKTGPGQYGEGDVFLGLNAKAMHALSKEFRALSLAEVKELLQSAIHDERGVALLILVRAFEKADKPAQKQMFDFYLAHTDHINNWDLVDCSAPHIVGAYLLGRGRQRLRRLAKSQSVWERRIAVVATQCFIRAGEFADTLAIAEMLLDDEHDLIHKACGWMLREVGKRDTPALVRFLEKHRLNMPRTMLRYAIERFPPKLRRRFLAKD